jgi:hypothetical protein
MDNEQKNEKVLKIDEALLKLATGYEYEEKEIIADKYGNTGRVKIIKKHMPPNIQAIIMCQKNYKNK